MTERQAREWPILVKIAKEYSLSPEDTIMLLSIRDAEAGPPGYEFGVKAAKNSNIEEQARWAAGSIVANRKRYQALMQEGVYKGTGRQVGLSNRSEMNLHRGENVSVGDIDFPEFMAYYGSPTGYGWAPIHDPNMPEKEVALNKNWAGNVRKLMEKHTKLFKEKGMEVK